MQQRPADFLRTTLDRAPAGRGPGNHRRPLRGGNFIQRFDSALRLNVQLHALVLDGVFVEPRKGSRPVRGSRPVEPVFRRLPPPTDEEAVRLVQKIARRTLRWLVRQGVLTEEGDEDGGEVLQHYRAVAPRTRGCSEVPRRSR